MPKKWFFISIVLLLSFFECAYATMDEEAAINDNGVNSPPQQGNFALSAPQQPGPFLSFGQTLIGRNNLQLQYINYTVAPESAGGSNRNIGLMYGFTDATALYLNFPIESSYNTRHTRASGLSDVILQLEHAVYSAGTTKYQEQATVVGALTLPLQDSTNLHRRNFPGQISVGYGSPVYFFGATYNRTYVDWLAFVSPGILITPVSDHIQLGSQALYQAGLGRTIKSASEKYILFGLLEFQGQYTAKDNEFGRSLRNTGGNVIALAPSLWLSTRHLILQAGVSLPIVQNLNGNQTKSAYSVALTVTWTLAEDGKIWKPSALV